MHLHLSHFAALASLLQCAIDEIVLSYMISILEELGNNAADDDIFDVDQFTEMMEAYLPGFQDFNSVEVSEWMFELAGQLASLKFDDVADSASGPLPSPPPLPPPDSLVGSLDMSILHLSKSAPTPSYNETCHNGRTPTESERFRSCSVSSSSSNAISSDSDDVDPIDVETLREMFPETGPAELIHCLVLSDGNLEQAALWVLHRQETGESLAQTQKMNGLRHRSSIPETMSDHQMKKSIVDKYSYVDTDEDKKLHRPIVPKAEPKKMIRYLDSKVVSVKGERFTEIKKPESEEAKNSLINLKPYRQYRFH